MEPPGKTRLIGVVGPCGSGKSTLVEGLEKQGYECRHIAQEHSYVPDMWQVITQPGILIYLNASFAVSTDRAKLNWQKKDHNEQLRRLSHARTHAHLIIETDTLRPEDVLLRVLAFLAGTGRP